MPVRRLDPITVDRIAAGEVIERPASVVKELVENALDAGATHIDTVVEAGGTRLIRVVDDGCGMTAADLELAVERHATSKLPDDNLDTIATLGFRGEALPSIGSVARLEILSRSAQSTQGHRILVEAGRKHPVRPAAQPPGTRIEIRDLFAATPARLKFLKSERAEALAIADVVKRLALANPRVRFALAGGVGAGFDHAGCSADAPGVRARVAQVLGAAFDANALTLDAVREHVVLRGLVGLPTFNRGNALMQYLFVNGRPVRDKLLYGAVRAAYADYLAADRHPALVLFLGCDPAFVDVNVHPAKAEVRFRDAGLVRGLIVGALRDTLAGALHRATTTNGDRALDALMRRAGVNAGMAFGARPPSGGWDWRGSPAAPAPGFGVAGFAEPEQFGLRGPEALSPEAEPASSGLTEAPLGAARAQLHETYIVAQTRDGIVIVDQHAAHERLVYERLKAQRAANQVARQILLIPAVVDLDTADVERLLDQRANLEASGLVLEGFGSGAVVVREVPALLDGVACDRLVRDVADALAAEVHTGSLERRLDQVLATIACHHSVRAGRRLRPDEMNALLREMEATPGAGQCNHGRPTYVELKLVDIERLFGRR